MSPPTVRAKVRVVVDGSNLATEGRTTPSLVQLDAAVRAFLEEHPRADVIVVADATFEHRIAPTERARFKEAELAGEIVTPPAGAVGRGDAFILQIAARIGAVVLSNDSFQEFHEAHPWLFEEGRLIGGKPVPGVGWVFTPRLPVRGAKAAKATRIAKRLAPVLPDGTKPKIGATLTPPKPATRVKGTVPKAAVAKATKATKKAAPKKAPAKPAAPKPAKAAPKKAAPRATAREKAASEPVEPAVALRRGRQPVNPPSEFAKFVAAHRVRSHVAGDVTAFTSHGAIISVTVTGGAAVECYAPTTLLGTPPPARARDVLKRGDHRSFRLVSVDKDRRIAELALL